MRIVITGGAGFIGSNLCLQLKAKHPDYSLVAFDNLRRRGSELNLPDFKKFGIEFIHGDIRNPEDLQAIGSFDLMIEASAEPSVLAGLSTDPTFVIQNNLYGSINCFNACLHNKAKLIFLSTSRVYPIAPIENANFIEEETRFSFHPDQTEPGISSLGISEKLSLAGARSFYGATKLSSEQFIQEYASFYGLEAAVTRFGVVAGPRQMGKTDQGIATLWMAKHFWKNSITYIGYNGSGKQVRDILHIDDLITLIEMQIHQMDKFIGKVFNAGGGMDSSISLLEMTALCEKITGHKVEVNRQYENRPADLRIFISDNTSIVQDTGWKPTKTLTDIFSDTFHWMKKNESSLKPMFN